MKEADFEMESVMWKWSILNHELLLMCIFVLYSTGRSENTDDVWLQLYQDKHSTNVEGVVYPCDSSCSHLHNGIIDSRPISEDNINSIPKSEADIDFITNSETEMDSTAKSFHNAVLEHTFLDFTSVFVPSSKTDSIDQLFHTSEEERLDDSSSRYSSVTGMLVTDSSYDKTERIPPYAKEISLQQKDAFPCIESCNIVNNKQSDVYKTLYNTKYRTELSSLLYSNQINPSTDVNFPTDQSSSFNYKDDVAKAQVKTETFVLMNETKTEIPVSHTATDITGVHIFSTSSLKNVQYSADLILSPRSANSTIQYSNRFSVFYTNELQTLQAPESDTLYTPVILSPSSTFSIIQEASNSESDYHVSPGLDFYSGTVIDTSTSENTEISVSSKILPSVHVTISRVSKLEILVTEGTSTQQRRDVSGGAENYVIEHSISEQYSSVASEMSEIHPGYNTDIGKASTVNLSYANEISTISKSSTLEKSEVLTVNKNFKTDITASSTVGPNSITNITASSTVPLNLTTDITASLTVPLNLTTDITASSTVPPNLTTNITASSTVPPNLTTDITASSTVNPNLTTDLTASSLSAHPGFSSDISSQVSAITPSYKIDILLSDSTNKTILSTATQHFDLKPSIAQNTKPSSSFLAGLNGNTPELMKATSTIYVTLSSEFVQNLHSELFNFSVTSSESMSTDNNSINVTPVLETSQNENVFTSLDSMGAYTETAKPIYRRTTEGAPASQDSKDWAVPVTICLSVVLFLTLILLLRQCRKSRLTYDHEVGESSYTHVAGQQNPNTANPAQFHNIEPRQGFRQQSPAKPISSKGSNLNQSFDHRNGNATSFTRNHEDFESENLQQKGRGNQEFSQDFNIMNDAYNYNNRCYLPNSDSLDSLKNLTSILETPKAAGRVSSSGNHVPRSPKGSPRVYDNEKLSNAHSSNDGNSKMYGHSDSYITINGDDHNGRNSFRSSAPIYINKGHMYDEHGKGWSNEQRYTIRDDEENENIITFLSRGSRYKNAELEFEEDDDDEVEELHSSTSRFRPGISKCVSFDESQLHAERDKIFLHKHTSPNRKISTISDSAAMYLRPPGGGFMNTPAVYETFDNLANIGQSPSGSKFFIGSYPEGVNLLGQSMRNSKERLDLSAEFRKEDEFEPRELRYSNRSIEKNARVRNSNSESHASKISDDYIFPIVKNAKIRILAEREQRKQTDKRGRGYTEGSSTGTSAQNWQLTDRKISAHSLMGDVRRTPIRPSLLSQSFSTTSQTPTPAPISPTSNIPKIILTHDDGETGNANKRSDSKSIIKSPRIRRIARVNNPFLIEVDSPANKITEKFRRSSAPAMAYSQPSPVYSSTKDRIIKSASGDHLYPGLHNDGLGCSNQPATKSWSSEFLNLVRNSECGSPAEQERIRKMVDDRYNALFANKYSTQSGAGDSNRQSFAYNQPLDRIQQILQHTNMSRNADESSNIEMTKHMVEAGVFAKYRSDFESGHSRSPSSASYSSLQINVDQNRIPSWEQSNLIDENTSRISSFRSPDAGDNTSSATSLRHRESPRPSLTHGTDGLDKDIELQRTNSEISRLETVDDNISRDRSFTYPEHVGTPSARRAAVTTLQWESFDNDFNTGRLCSSTPVSENSLFSDKDGGRRSPMFRITERASPDRAWRSPQILPANQPNVTKHAAPDYTLVHETGQEIQAKQGTGQQSRKDNQTYVWNRGMRSPFIPIEAPSTESESETTSPPSKQKGFYPPISSPNREQFEDSFDATVYVNSQNINVTNQTKLSQNFRDAIPDIGSQRRRQRVEENGKERRKETGTTPPIRPRRRQRKRPENNEVRLPNSPNTSNNRNNSLAPITYAEDSINSTTERIRGLRCVRPASTEIRVDRGPRSYSFVETSGQELHGPRCQRAVSLETDRLRSYYANVDDWTKLFRENSSRFVTSANNTVLEHSSSEDTTAGSTSISESEMQLYFKPASVADNCSKKHRDRRSRKQVILSDKDDGRLQVSNI